MEEALAEAARHLETRGQPATPQRLAVVAAPTAQRRRVTAQELHAALRRVQPHLGLATVYRTLDMLVRCALAEAFPQASNETRYAFRSARRHHHLVCQRCGLVVELTGSALESLGRTVERESRFTVDDQALTLVGACQDCHARCALVTTGAGGADAGTASTPPVRRRAAVWPVAEGQWLSFENKDRTWGQEGEDRDATAGRAGERWARTPIPQGSHAVQA